MTEIYKPMFVDLLCTWHAYYHTNIGLKVKSLVLNCYIMKPVIELLKLVLESYKPMIIVFKQVRSSNTGL